MLLAVLKEKAYLVNAPALEVPDESTATVVEVSAPMSPATPISPKIRFSSRRLDPLYVRIWKFPVPPAAEGFNTCEILTVVAIKTKYPYIRWELKLIYQLRPGAEK